jgi:hypothetical protein
MRTWPIWFWNSIMFLNVCLTSFIWLRTASLALNTTVKGETRGGADHDGGTLVMTDWRCARARARQGFKKATPLEDKRLRRYVIVHFPKHTLFPLRAFRGEPPPTLTPVASHHCVFSKPPC